MFDLEAGEANGPRAGKLRLPSGLVVETPLFMPVATKLSVKTLTPYEVEATGTTVLITNGFLSHLEPGSEVISRMGGMHSFMRWNGGIFSDSGGFQFIRKGFDAKVDDRGVSLRSPYSGVPIFLTPEDVVDFHTIHGVDVGMVLDHCPPYASSEEGIIASARRTLLWARRSKERSKLPSTMELSVNGEERQPLIFAITQGGTYQDIRRENTSKLVELDLPGYGVGGLSIGESKEEMFRSLEASTSLLPAGKPRYFMGVGEPVDLIRSVMSGVDIFDSVFPTRNARHRSLLIPGGRENIRAGGWKGIDAPIMYGCNCPTCRSYSRGYLHHLFKTQEPLGPRLATIHNIHFMQTLVRGIRERVLEDPGSVRMDPMGLMAEIFRE
ncbi:MAG: tRNA guanosine(34) transglycosylase Tgt [Thermoplasmatota archaeon]